MMNTELFDTRKGGTSKRVLRVKCFWGFKKEIL